MTQPSRSVAPRRGWWPRVARIGVGAVDYGWLVTASGGVPHSVVAHMRNATAAMSGTATVTETGTAAVTARRATAAMSGNTGLTVAFNAVGTGNTGASGTVSWSHTAAAGAYVVAFVEVVSGTTVSSVTYGGNAMTLLGSVFNDTFSTIGILYAYGRANVAGGAQTVTATLSGGFNGGGNSVSYTNVSSVTTSTTGGDATAAMTQTITGAAGAMIAQAFGDNGSGGAYTANNRTLRYSTSIFGQPALIVQDVATIDGSAVAVTASHSTTAYWSGIGVRLNP